MLILFFIYFFLVGIPYYIIQRFLSFVILFFYGSHEPIEHNSGCKVTYKYSRIDGTAVKGIYKEEREKESALNGFHFHSTHLKI